MFCNHLIHTAFSWWCFLLSFQTNYIVSNYDEAWTYEYFFAEPVPARYVRFIADQVDDSKCLFGLTLTGCTLGKQPVTRYLLQATKEIYS